jgi:hypothetical protein
VRNTAPSVQTQWTLSLIAANDLDSFALASATRE